MEVLREGDSFMPIAMGVEGETTGGRQEVRPEEELPKDIRDSQDISFPRNPREHSMESEVWLW